MSEEIQTKTPDIPEIASPSEASEKEKPIDIPNVLPVEPDIAALQRTRIFSFEEVKKLELTSLPNPNISDTKPNIIVFGETGSGKSSIINMLTGGDPVKASNGAAGVTFQNQCCPKTIRGSEFNILDTVGLNEGDGGTVPLDKAIEHLYGCIRQLPEGVHLLVYVMRAPRLKDTAKNNYDMFFKTFCRGKVPIVMIVTGLEDMSDMDQWWLTNAATFDKAKMKFQAVACITSHQGKKKNGRYMFQEEYEQSTKKVEALIYESYARIGWILKPDHWIIAVLSDLCYPLAAFLGFDVTTATCTLRMALERYGNVSATDAQLMAKDFENGLGCAKWVKFSDEEDAAPGETSVEAKSPPALD